MHTITALTVNCPRCGASLMDNRTLIDNSPSIKLNVSVGDQRGVVRLSSVYGSPNITSSFEIPAETIAHFFCPECNGEIIGHAACSTCSAPLVTLQMANGGSISFCSRRGCRKHLIEFEDLDLAMRMLHEESDSVLAGPGGGKTHERVFASSSEEAAQSLLRAGTCLLTYCPYCRRSLLAEGAWKFSITRGDGQAGQLYLSPYLNDFTHTTSLPLEEGAVLADLRCFHCNSTLRQPEQPCPRCAAPTATTMVASPGKLIEFRICTRKGCRWHGVSRDDVASVELDGE